MLLECRTAGLKTHHIFVHFLDALPMVQTGALQDLLSEALPSSCLQPVCTCQLVQTYAFTGAFTAHVPKAAV